MLMQELQRKKIVKRKFYSLQVNTILARNTRTRITDSINVMAKYATVDTSMKSLSSHLKGDANVVKQAKQTKKIREVR